MRITRRQLLKDATAAAILTQTHLLTRVRPVKAAPVNDPILVLVHLAGGNDAFNTLVPFDDVGSGQRSLYEQLRPDLAIPRGDLEATALGRDTGLALHPNLIELARLFAQRKLALVSGVGVVDSSLSHSRAQEVWETGDPVRKPGTGWIGRQMDTFGPSSAPGAVSFGDAVNLSLSMPSIDSLSTSRVSEFGLSKRLSEQHRKSWEAIYAEGRDPASLAGRAARSGRLALPASDKFQSIDTDGWGSHNDVPLSSLGHDLRDVASILRHDIQNPGDDTGLRFFHVSMGGFDSHANQGTTSTECGHGQLLHGLSTALDGFQGDLSAIGAADRVVTLVYSEFGRRAHQNNSGASAGTDHGRAGLVMLMGEPVRKGLYGEVPDLADLDWDGNPKVTTDFRRVYATLIDQWLGGDHTAVLPGGPFEPLPVLAASYRARR